MKRHLQYLVVAFTLLLPAISARAQAPHIAYSPVTNAFTVGTAITPLTPTNSSGAVPAATYGTVTTFAGSGAVGMINNTGTLATFSSAMGVGMDASGNLYIPDVNNNEIRKITPAGVVTLFAGSPTGASGSANGAATTAALFNSPYGVTVDQTANVYIADRNNNLIRKYNSATGQVVLLAGGSAVPFANGTGAAASFNSPMGVAYNSHTGFIYVADFNNNQIRQITNSTGVVTLLAGSATGVSGSTDGTGTGALFNGPSAICADASGNVYVADQNNNIIRKITSAGVVTTMAGSGAAAWADGTGAAASFNAPQGITVDAAGNVYVGDSGNNRIRKITPAGVVTTIAGSGAAALTNGLGTAAAFNSPRGLRIDPSTGNLFVADNGNNVIREVITTGYMISPALPSGLSFDVTTGIITGTPGVISPLTAYTVTAYNASGSYTTTVNISCTSTYFDWLGGTSNIWLTPSNWSTGTVPGPSDNIRIGVVPYTNSANEPWLAASRTFYGSITFGTAHPASTISISNGVTLTVGGSMTVPTGATATIKTNGAGTGAVDIAPGAILNINGTGTLTITSPLKFTLKSNAFGDGSIGQITSSSIQGTGANSIVVERYLNGGSAGYRGNRLLSSPVFNTVDTHGNNSYSINYLINSMYLTSTVTNGGFDNPAPANPSLYFYRENLIPDNSTFTTGNFRAIYDITTNPKYSIVTDGANYYIHSGNGYLVFFRGNRASASYATETTPGYVPQPVTLSTSGTLNAGQIVVRDWFNSTSPNLSYTPTSPVGVKGYNLIGNPYACAIDWDTFQSGSPTTGIYGTNVTTTMYTLDPLTKTYGSYIAGSGGVGSASFVSNVISSGQGFFVVATCSCAQFFINESAKTTKNNNGLKLLMGKPANNANIQYLRLQMGQDSVISEQTLIRFNNQSTTAFNSNIDAAYLKGYGEVSLSSKSSDQVDLSINTVPLPAQKSQVIKLNIDANNSGTYLMKVKDLVAVPRLFDLWLMDAYKKDSVNLRAESSYSFNINKGDNATFGANRFTLVIRQDPNFAYHLLDFTASKVQAARQVEIVWKTSNEENYTNFTVERSIDNGKTFEVLGGVKAAALGSYSILDKNPVPGQNLYRLKQEDFNNSISYSKVVLIQYADLGSTLVGNKLSIYPNPASSTINLAAAPQATENATYSIKIMNSSGIVIKTITSSQPTWQGSVSNLRPGTYLIRMVNNKTQNLVGENKFVKL